MSKVSCAVLGCGAWGRNHVRVLSELAESRVLAVADRNDDRLAILSARFPGLRRHKDHRALLDDPAVEAVVIATEASAHAALVREALEADKHVLCEKPLCVRPEDAAALVALASRRRRTLMVGHTFLFNPGIRRLKSLVDGGELGGLRHLSALRTNLGPIRDDVNAVYDLACHDVAIFNWLLGALPLRVRASGASYLQPGIEDVAHIDLEYPQGVLANIHVSWYDPQKLRRITVVGDRRMASWDDLDTRTPVTLYDKGAGADREERRALPVVWDRGAAGIEVPYDEPLKAQDRAFVDAVRNFGMAMPTDELSSVGIVQVLAAANRSIALGGGAVELAPMLAVSA
jgi:predicted dehydrogenase